MSKAEKTLNTLLRGTSDANIPFKDLCSFMLKLNYGDSLLNAPIKAVGLHGMLTRKSRY
jgi:hypothetical protein